MDAETIGGSGYTLEQLSAYLDRGRTPRIAAIEDDAECRALLDSMARLGTMTRTLADADAAALDPIEEPWYEDLLAAIRREVRAGRDLQLDDPDERTSTTITEGALRELARRAGDSVDDVLVARVSLRDSAALLDVRIEVGVRYGAPVHDRADEVRLAVHAALAPHAPRTLGDIDVIVVDVFPGGAP